jgi:hypothetical protein
MEITLLYINQKIIKIKYKKLAKYGVQKTFYCNDFRYKETIKNENE